MSRLLSKIDALLERQGLEYMMGITLVEVAKYSRHSPVLKERLLKEVERRLDTGDPDQLSPLTALVLLDVLGELK